MKHFKENNNLFTHPVNKLVTCNSESTCVNLTYEISNNNLIMHYNNVT